MAPSVAKPDNSLVGLWHFDEGSGTTAYDSSGYNNHGTITGAAWVTGMIKKALSFDGVDDYVAIPDIQQLDGKTEVSLNSYGDRTELYERTPYRAYTIINLGLLGNDGTSVAHCINDLGQVAGWSDLHAFLWSNLLRDYSLPYLSSHELDRL